MAWVGMVCSSSVDPAWQSADSSGSTKCAGRCMPVTDCTVRLQVGGVGLFSEVLNGMMHVSPYVLLSPKG